MRLVGLIHVLFFSGLGRGGGGVGGIRCEPNFGLGNLIFGILRYFLFLTDEIYPKRTRIIVPSTH